MIEISTVMSIDNLKIHQEELPTIHSNRVRLIDSKWHHAEEEILVAAILEIVAPVGVWRAVSLNEIVKHLKKNRLWKSVFNESEAEVMISLSNIASTHDVTFTKVFRKKGLWVVPQPPLKSTFEKCAEWYPRSK